MKIWAVHRPLVQEYIIYYWTTAEYLNPTIIQFYNGWGSSQLKIEYSKSEHISGKDCNNVV